MREAFDGNSYALDTLIDTGLYNNNEAVLAAARGLVHTWSTRQQEVAIARGNAVSDLLQEVVTDDVRQQIRDNAQARAEFYAQASDAFEGATRNVQTALRDTTDSLLGATDSVRKVVDRLLGGGPSWIPEEEKDAPFSKRATEEQDSGSATVTVSGKGNAKSWGVSSRPTSPIVEELKSREHLDLGTRRLTAVVDSPAAHKLSQLRKGSSVLIKVPSVRDDTGADAPEASGPRHMAAPRRTGLELGDAVKGNKRVGDRPSLRETVGMHRKDVRSPASTRAKNAERKGASTDATPKT